MRGLPESKIYELELEYWPYKTSWQKVLEIITKDAPKNGTLLDLMCGPGYLLGQISQKRPDLQLKGLDIDERYIKYSKETYPNIDFELGNVLTWQPKELFDVVTCTGSVHHLPYEKQQELIASIARMVKPNGFVLISDCYVDDYSSEKERKLAAAKLGYEYLKFTIENGAPEEAIKPCVDIMYNDIFMDEFKDSMKKREPKLHKVFGKVETIKTWPKFGSQYGDYIHICKNKVGGWRKK